MREEFLWVEKYRPKTVSECILPRPLKKTFTEFVENKEIPNLLLHGSAGVGKTTIARALCISKRRTKKKQKKAQQGKKKQEKNE